MLDELGPLLKNLPPKTAGALVQAINRCGREIGMGPAWVRRWVGFTVVADALASYAPEGEQVFELKGGAAIEMRLRQFAREGSTDFRPRATKDLDATFRGAMEDLVRAVRAALAEPRHNFTFRVEIETPHAPMMKRLTVHVAYQEKRFGRIMEKGFSNVQLEVSAYEGIRRESDMVPAFSLKPFGLDGPRELPCLRLTKQIAQKLHAVTEQPDSGRPNDRFRDLLDIIVLGSLAPPTPELREVCEETFRIRAKQEWPPDIMALPHWIEPMEQRAQEMGLPHATSDEIVRHVAGYVRAIAAAE